MSRDTWPLDLQNPVELNRYVYAMGNPVTWSDPSGYTTGYSILNSRNASRTAPAVGLLGYKTAYSFGSVVFNILFASANWPYLEDIIDDLVLDPIWVDFIENLDFDGLPDPDPDTNPNPRPQCCAEPINPNPENDEDDLVHVGYHGTNQIGSEGILRGGLKDLGYSDPRQLGPGFYVDQNRDVARFWAAEKFGNSVLSIWMRRDDFNRLNRCDRGSNGFYGWWPGIDEVSRHVMHNANGICDVEIALYDRNPPEHVQSTNVYPHGVPGIETAKQWKFNVHVFPQLIPMPAVD